MKSVFVIVQKLWPSYSFSCRSMRSTFTSGWGMTADWPEKEKVWNVDKKKKKRFPSSQNFHFLSYILISDGNVQEQRIVLG